MAIDLRPYFDALGVPRSALRLDDQGRVVEVAGMPVVPQSMQPRIDREAIAQAIQTLRQALPDPGEGIQAALRAVAQVAPMLGQIAQQLPTTLQAREVAANLTGFLPGGRPTEARQARLAQQAIARAQLAAQQEANRVRQAEALAQLLLGTTAPGQTITLTPEQQAQLGPFASFLQGRSIPATTAQLTPNAAAELLTSIARAQADPYTPPGVKQSLGALTGRLTNFILGQFGGQPVEQDPLSAAVIGILSDPTLSAEEKSAAISRLLNPGATQTVRQVIPPAQTRPGQSLFLQPIAAGEPRR